MKHGMAALAIGLMTTAGTAAADCSDKDIAQVRLFGLYQQANARIPDGQLANIFASSIGRERNDFKAMVRQCAAQAKPGAAEDAFVAERKALLAACAKKDAGDEVCKAVRDR